MNLAFRDCVTNTAFSLILGKTHLAALHAVESGQRKLMGEANRFVPGVHGLIRRGLVTHHEPNTHPDFSPDWPFAVPFSYVYQLTEAGRLVCALAREAGLFPAIETEERSAA